MSFPLPIDEKDRLRALRRYEVLDTQPEAVFDHVTQSLSQSLKVPVALITLLDENRQWFKSSCGLDATETPREVAFCAHAIMGNDIMVVSDACRDPRFAGNPLVTGAPHVRFYAGMPLITPDGHKLGTLCVVDFAPRELGEGEAAILTHLGKLVVELFELRLQARRVVTIEQTARLDAENRMLEKSAQLLESNERFREMASRIPGIVYQFRIDAAGQMSFPYVSPMIEPLLGLDPSAVMKNPDILFGRVLPEDQPGLRASIEETYRTNQPWKWEGRALNAEGKIAWFRGTSTPKRLDDGSVLWNGLIIDQTDLRHTQEQLRQAQKMEAVGQLTGGIAHDFNNLLAIIIGNVELLAGETKTANRGVQAIQRAVQRGAELTHRLLAFSRRQNLVPQAVELGPQLAGTCNLLSRSLGETIAIRLDIAPDCWPALVDAGQLENAIVNLAINARDAMPGGGELVISCTNTYLSAEAAAAFPNADVSDPVAAGDYVVISISDSGTGMSHDIRARAFEPFFTTKEVGQGSGLGLSMVYGFSRQSGGTVSLESEEGNGTTVRLYLPRGERKPERGTDIENADLPLGKGEKILVVEDDPDVRVLIVRMLETLNYLPVESANATAAAEMVAQHSDIALILSDVVLPGGTSGPEFMADLRRVRPNLSVIFMSGYPQSFMGKLAEAGGSEPKLLTKPFGRQALAAALSEVLAR